MREQLQRRRGSREVRGAAHMAPADAMWHWFSTKFATDQFLIYVFDGAPESLAAAVEATLERARGVPSLGVRIREDRFGFRFPRWAHVGVDSSQSVVHRLPTPTWNACLDAVAALIDQQVDPREAAWRLHVFSPVADVPSASGPATVVVLQITHALGDGPRTAALAASLFGRDSPPAAIERLPTGRLIPTVIAAARARRELARDTAAGRVPAAKGAVPALRVNDQPTGRLVLRTLVRDAAQLPGPTLTVGALVAVSEALSGYLRARGEDASQLTAAVPMAKNGVARANNHIALAWIGLHPDAQHRDEQIRRIVADVMDWRRRSRHRAFLADEAAIATIPAPLRRVAITLVRSSGRRRVEVPAHTVVSSVDRGPADLSFGGCPVLFTSGFAALLPIASLTHGVHRIGGTVAITVHASIPQVDVDDYLARLDAALPR